MSNHETPVPHENDISVARRLKKFVEDYADEPSEDSHGNIGPDKQGEIVVFSHSLVPIDEVKVSIMHTATDVNGDGVLVPSVIHIAEFIWSGEPIITLAAESIDGAIEEHVTVWLGDMSDAFSEDPQRGDMFAASLLEGLKID